MPKFVGAHVSASGGVDNAPLNAMNIGAKAFAVFTKKNTIVEPITKIITLSGKLKSNAGSEKVVPVE